MIKRYQILLALAIYLPQWSLSAQPTLSIDTQSGYLSNAFRNYYAVPDYYTDFTGKIVRNFITETRGIQFYYQGSVDLFKTYRYRNYHQHSLGSDFYTYMGDDGNRIRAGVEVSKRFHSEDYQWYELQQTLAYMTGKWIFQPQLYGYFGIRLHWRNYRKLSDFSHFETVIYARLSRFFDSGTSLIFEGNLLTKRYYPSNGISSVSDLPEIVTLGTGTSQQIVGLIRTAQSILPTLGISAQGLVRHNLTGSVRYLGSVDGFYYSDEELFDDVYGYNSKKILLTITKRLPLKITLSAGNSITWKNYDLRLALDLQGNPFADYRLRKDKRQALWLRVEKTLGLGSNLSPLKLRIEWASFWNRSNDPYYDYSAHNLMMSIAHDF